MCAISPVEDKQVRRAWNAAEEKWHFSIDDVVQALTGSVNVKDHIKNLLKRDPEQDSYRGTDCPPVDMMAADGKRRKVKAAKDGGSVAGDARRDLESKSGRKVSTPDNFKSLPESRKRLKPSEPSQSPSPNP